VQVLAGGKKYGAALDQLFRYLTWRQNYGVLVTFCKSKDMTAAIRSAKQVMQEHPSWTAASLGEVSESRFVTRHSHPQDPERSVEVHHLFFDLSL
jgi:hypothetical protein